jgi:hypothetical protein
MTPTLFTARRTSNSVLPRLEQLSEPWTSATSVADSSSAIHFRLKIHLSWTDVTATLTATWAADGILWLPERRGCAARVLANLEFAELGYRKMGI